MKNISIQSFSKKPNSLTKAAIILALIIIVVFSPAIFLNQTYAGEFPFPLRQIGYEGKAWKYNTIDPAADYLAIRPGMMLATELIKEGTIPLWNPHQGGGTPLAADTINYIFSPTIFLFLLPVDFWDFGLLTHLWLAGLFMFLFLRSLKLNFTSSISGSTLYMLSGAFVWFLPHTHIPVMVFTPFILYSLEKLIQTRETKYIVLTSIAFCFGILGAHLESIILQLLLVGAYFVYRVVFPLLRNYYLKNKNKIPSKELVLHKANLKKIVSWSLVAFVGALGLSAFFIIPVYELATESNLPHTSKFGLHFQKRLVLSYPFVPHIVGVIHSNITPEINDVHRWNNVFGFVGIFSLFFAIVSIFSIIKNKFNDDIHKYTPLFFLGIGIFFIMKTYGVPVVNWIGTLPLLDMIAFPRYSGVIIPIGFAVSAAFGVEWLCKSKVKKNILAIVGSISFLIILVLSINFFLFLSEESNISSQTLRDSQIFWTTFQLLITGLFLVMVILIAAVASGNKSANSAIVFLIILELSLFIPLGLDHNSMFDKSIITLIGMIAITIFTLKPNRISWNLKNTPEKKLRLSSISVILIATAFGWVIVSEQSPTGIADRFDFWKDNDLTIPLKENLEDYRMFSFHAHLGPNSPSGYRIDSLSLFTPFITEWFASFNRNFLNPEPNNSNLGFHNFEYQFGSEASNIYLQNKKFYDFMGVKYLVATRNVDPNSYLVNPPGRTSIIPIDLSENIVEQEFKSPIEQINSLNFLFIKSKSSISGQVILTIDSIPKNNDFHREVTLNGENIKKDLNVFQFIPLNNVMDKKLKINLKYLPSNADDVVEVLTHNGTENISAELKKGGKSPFENVKDRIQGKLFVNNFPTDGVLIFSISSEIVAIERSGFLTLYENPNAFPRVFLVDKFQTAESYTEAQNKIKEPDFNLRKEIVIENDQANQFERLGPISQEAEANIISYEPNEVKIKVKNETPAFLVLTDTYYPGWRAYVDGEETTIYRTNGLVRSVLVPGGDHTVTFSYLPKSFLMGVAISLITTGLLLGLILYSRRKKANQINRYTSVTSSN